VTKWPKENIPNPDRLFYRVHAGQLVDGALHAGIFREQGDSMSADWEKYSTPQQSRSRAAQPTRNGIIALVAGDVRGVGMTVEHTPDEPRNNRAHSSIGGLGADKAKKVKLRVKLLELSSGWLVAPGENLIR
jgi:hypothetical protein